MQTLFWNTLNTTEQKGALLRPVVDTKAFNRQVAALIQQVQKEGDIALFALTAKHDHASLLRLAVSEEEIDAAKKKVSAVDFAAIQFAYERIQTYHRLQIPVAHVIETIPGVRCTRQPRPIQRVGLYVPAGSAPLVSSVLMQGVPAQLAACPVRILATPPHPTGEIDPRLLVAADLCGIRHIFKVGGAHAIAAMAYGTESILKVDKIFGPGNAWVTQAKLQVSQDPSGAAIDMPAGPSEVMVIADDAADPAFVAADLLSQAEHGPDSQVMLVTLSRDFAQQVEYALQAQLERLTRRAIAEQSLQHARCIIVEDMQKAISVSNAYAPEHLILQVEEAARYVSAIQNAGAVFVGKWTPETVGDYVTGSNHVLPTAGYARTWSGLSVLDCMKWISVQEVTQAGLQKIGPYAETLATIEGLDAHKNAVSLRLK
jgi:histidinol dehydrogenase